MDTLSFDRIAGLKNGNQFPLGQQCVKYFESLQSNIANASLQAVQETRPFVVLGCDASGVAVSAATLSQRGRPAASMLRSLSRSELHYPSMEYETWATVEAMRK